MFTPRQQLSDPVGLDTVTGPISASTSVRRSRAVRPGQIEVRGSSDVDPRGTRATNSTGGSKPASALDARASSSGTTRSGAARSGTARPRGTHRAVQRGAATKQGHGRLVIAGTASLASISALVTGMALSGGHDSQASEIGTTGAAPSTGAADRSQQVPGPLVTSASRSINRTPLTGLIPAAGHPRSNDSGGRVDGSDPATAAGGLSGPEANQPQGGFPTASDSVDVAPGTPGALGTPGIDTGGNPLPPAAELGVDQPSTGQATTGSVDNGPVAEPSAGMSQAPTTLVTSPTPSTGLPTDAPAGATAPADGTATTAQSAVSGTSSGGQTPAGQPPVVPDATVSPPAASPPPPPSDTVIELRDVPPVWPHSR